MYSECAIAGFSVPATYDQDGARRLLWPHAGELELAGRAAVGVVLDGGRLRRRLYPQPEVAGHVLAAADLDRRTGRRGIEPLISELCETGTTTGLDRGNAELESLGAQLAGWPRQEAPLKHDVFHPDVLNRIFGDCHAERSGGVVVVSFPNGPAWRMHRGARRDVLVTPAVGSGAELDAASAMFLLTVEAVRAWLWRVEGAAAHALSTSLGDRAARMLDLAWRRDESFELWAQVIVELDGEPPRGSLQALPLTQLAAMTLGAAHRRTARGRRDRLDDPALLPLPERTRELLSDGTLTCPFASLSLAGSDVVSLSALVVDADRLTRHTLARRKVPAAAIVALAAAGAVTAPDEPAPPVLQEEFRKLVTDPATDPRQALRRALDQRVFLPLQAVRDLEETVRLIRA